MALRNHVVTTRAKMSIRDFFKPKFDLPNSDGPLKEVMKPSTIRDENKKVSSIIYMYNREKDENVNVQPICQNIIRPFLFLAKSPKKKVLYCQINSRYGNYKTPLLLKWRFYYRLV